MATNNVYIILKEHLHEASNVHWDTIREQGVRRLRKLRNGKPHLHEGSKVGIIELIVDSCQCL